MKSEVRFNNEKLTEVPVDFSDLKNGEGIVDLVGNLRLRVSDYDYIHFSTLSETVGFDNESNWPPNLKTDQPIRKFKLIAEEI